MSFRNLIVLYLFILSSCQSNKGLDYNFITSTYKRYSTSISRNENDDKFYYSKFNNNSNIEHYVSIESKNKNKISISGYLIYYKYGNEFLLKNRKVTKYKYNCNDKYYSYQLEKGKNNKWNYIGNPIVDYMQQKSESKYIIYFSTYLISDIRYKYSFDGKSFKDIDIYDCRFMPFIKEGIIYNPENNDIYIQMEISKTEVIINQFPNTFNDTIFYKP